MTKCPSCKRTDWHHHACPEYRRVFEERQREYQRKRLEEMAREWVPQDPAWHCGQLGPGDDIRLRALGVRWE